jgi:hypothetical protein
VPEATTVIPIGAALGVVSLLVWLALHVRGRKLQAITD